jgi:1-carboxybiuret hydrolase subunit AtzG-like
MAKARKSRAKAAARPGKRTGSRVRAAPGDPLEDFIKAAALGLALPLEPEWLPAIKANLETTLRLGALVAEFALPDESEPAAVFSA